MVKFDNPAIEEAFNKLFTDPEEKRLKVVQLPTPLPNLVYFKHRSDEDSMERYIDTIEEGIKKAKLALAFFEMARQLGVDVIHVPDPKKEDPSCPQTLF